MSDTQVIVDLLIALLPRLDALKLGTELYK